MLQNNKKTIISLERWAFILDFLVQNESFIKVLLHGAIHPDMLRTDIVLKNLVNGVPELTSVILPDGGNDVLVYTLFKPALYHPETIKQEIENIPMMDILSTVSNQIDVK
jgi:hypothetical protein